MTSIQCTLSNVLFWQRSHFKLIFLSALTNQSYQNKIMGFKFMFSDTRYFLSKLGNIIAIFREKYEYMSKPYYILYYVLVCSIKLSKNLENITSIHVELATCIQYISVWPLIMLMFESAVNCYLYWKQMTSQANKIFRHPLNQMEQKMQIIKKKYKK